MPIKKSAKKALRQTEKRTVINAKIKKVVKALESALQKEVIAKKKDAIKAMLPKFVQALDKATKNNIFSKNMASRKKSRLQKAINKLS